VVVLSGAFFECPYCKRFHPTAKELVDDYNGKDRPRDAEAWLAELADPHTRIGADRDGRVAIDWGVYGVPETFLIDKQGRIAFKQIGPVTEEVLAEKILPLVEKLRQSSNTTTNQSGAANNAD